MAQTVSRRTILKKTAVGTTIAWATPIVTTLGTPAYAANGSACSAATTFGWSSFSFSGVGDIPLTFALPGGTTGRFLDVTDGYLTGDVFEIFADGVSCGTTTNVPNLGTGVWTNNADTAYNDPRWSSGRFYVAPNTTVTISIEVIISPWGSGGAFVRAGNCSA